MNRKHENWTKIKNKRGLEFWRDDRTGLLWSPPLKDNYTFDEAVEITQASFVAELGKFKKRIWGIPTLDEVVMAIENGLLDFIPDLKSFWTSSVVSSNRQGAWFFYGSLGLVYDGPRYNAYVVRCVGRS